MADDKACCGAAKVMATTAGSEIDRLITRLNSTELALSAWQALAAEHGCETVPELRGFIGVLNQRLDSLRGLLNDRQQPAAPAPAAKPRQATPRRPFSITGLAGYHTAPGKVTLFLDRRLSASSITLDAEKLAALTSMASWG